MNQSFSLPEAKNIGEQIGIDFSKVDLNEFRAGLLVEQEHGSGDPETNITNDDLRLTAKIAWAHLKEMPDYYTRLNDMEHRLSEDEGGVIMKKLYLSAKDKKISGVCGGIGEYFESDPTLIRLGWIIITIVTGVVPGILAYFMAALVIPKKNLAGGHHG